MPLSLCVTQLIDVGTIPQPGAIERLYRAMHQNPQLGGVCGEITVRGYRPYSIVIASQIFEYKMSHILDKGTHSLSPLFSPASRLPPPL